MSWYVAKTSGRETRALQYLWQAGMQAVHFERHRYFTCPRTKAERFRVAALFPGYVFVQADRPERAAGANSIIGVSRILGDWAGGAYVPRAVPDEWVRQLIDAGPIIEGRRAKYSNGDQVRAIISGITSMVGTVEAHDGRTVQIRAPMFGSEMVIRVDEGKVEAA